MKTALVGIAKDEDHYIDEWIEYNKLLGFDDIIVYQNDWNANIKDGSVILKSVHGQNQQVATYNSFINEYYDKYDFAAFFDVDEFLVLKKHLNVVEFLSNYIDVPALAINWRMFGDSFLKKVVDNDYSVLKRFKYCENKLSNNCKFFINLKLTKNKLMFVFNPHCINSYAVDPNRKYLIRGIGSVENINDNSNDEIAELYHYRNKTFEECVQKRYKKQLVCTNGIKLDTYTNFDKFTVMFNEHNKNDVISTLAYDFYMSKKKNIV